MEETWRDRLVVASAKLSGYLPEIDHVEGGSKAAFFLKLGFSTSAPELLGEAILRHGKSQELAGTRQTPFGMRYVVEGEIETPSGRIAMVRSVWSEPETGGRIRLVTAYPLRRRP